MQVNAIAAWIGIGLGVVSGSVTGLRFHSETWLGGYGTWPRRMVRLGHIAFFGIGLLNLAYTLTIDALHWPAPPAACGWALAITILLMPGICYLSAWHKPLRNLFPIPVACVLAAVVGLLWRKAAS